MDRGRLLKLAQDSNYNVDYQLFRVSTEKASTIDMAEWRVVEMYYDMGLVFILCMKLDKDLMEELELEEPSPGDPDYEPPLEHKVRNEWDD